MGLSRNISPVISNPCPRGGASRECECRVLSCSPGRRQRCLVLADGFYEWQRQGQSNQPLYVRLRDGRPLAFAGLWEHWEGPEGQVIESCTLLTTTPNELIRTFHHRMPVIFDPKDYDLWLDPAIQDAHRVQPLLRPYPSEAMTAYSVSMRVNNPANDSPACISPLGGVPDLELGEAARRSKPER